jgi:hypothetical protein
LRYFAEFVSPKLRIKWQGKNSLDQAFSHGERTLFPAPEKGLLVKQEWIVNHRFDSLLGQVSAESFAFFMLHYEEMIDV